MGKIFLMHQKHPTTEMGKIIITGTGRAGTTFLIQLFTELGLDTGYTPENWRNDYDANASAGLEFDFGQTRLPRILKNPAFCETLPALLADGIMVIDHAIIPMRKLEEAAHSRSLDRRSRENCRRIVGYHECFPAEVCPGRKIPPIASHSHDPRHSSHTFGFSPLRARTQLYVGKTSVAVQGNWSRGFQCCLARVARPELIHDFSKGVPAGAGASARLLARAQLNRRLRRRAKRLLIWGAVAALGWLIFSFFRLSNSAVNATPSGHQTESPDFK